MFPKKSATSSISNDLSISAVVKCVNIIIQHNSFLNILDHLAPIIRQECSESKSARKFTCEKAKTDAIVNCTRGYFFEELKQGMHENPFSIMLDGSNDTRLWKIYTFTVRNYDVRFNLNLVGLSRSLFWGGGSKITPCLKLIRIMLELSNLVLKYTHIPNFRKYTFQC